MSIGRPRHGESSACGQSRRGTSSPPLPPPQLTCLAWKTPSPPSSKLAPFLSLLAVWCLVASGGRRGGRGGRSPDRVGLVWSLLSGAAHALGPGATPPCPVTECERSVLSCSQPVLVWFISAPQPPLCINCQPALPRHAFCQTQQVCTRLAWLWDWNQRRLLPAFIDSHKPPLTPWGKGGKWNPPSSSD